MSSTSYRALDEEMQQIRLRDGRYLEFVMRGKPGGTPVFYFPGSPGSAVSPLPDDLGDDVWLIAVNRPGFGLSTPHEGHKVLDFASDIEQLADALRIEKFFVVGRSGGGPYALACAAYRRLRTRVLGVATISCPSPPKDTERWFDKMSPSNVKIFKSSVAELVNRYGNTRERLLRDVEALVKDLAPELHGSDRELLADELWRNAIAEGHRDGMRWTEFGWVDYTIAVRSDWGFDPARDVGCVRLHVHGTEDAFVPVAQAADYFGRRCHLPVFTLSDRPGSLFFRGSYEERIISAVDDRMRSTYGDIHEGCVVLIDGDSHFPSFRMTSSVIRALIDYETRARSTMKVFVEISSRPAWEQSRPSPHPGLLVGSTEHPAQLTTAEMAMQAVNSQRRSDAGIDLA